MKKESYNNPKKPKRDKAGVNEDVVQKAKKTAFKGDQPKKAKNQGAVKTSKGKTLDQTMSKKKGKKK